MDNEVLQIIGNDSPTIVGLDVTESLGPSVVTKDNIRILDDVEMPVSPTGSDAELVCSAQPPQCTVSTFMSNTDISTTSAGQKSKASVRKTSAAGML